MTSRERVRLALEHKQPDWVPFDVGSSTVTGAHVSSVYKLRQALRLDPPGTPVKVLDPFWMLGEVAPDLMGVLGVDVAGILPYLNYFGFRNEDWKPWTAFDGTPVLVPGLFNTEPEPDGSLVQYPQGDRGSPASGRMPAGGFYHDAIIRQQPIDENRLDPADNLEEYGPISEEVLSHFRRQAEALSASGRAVITFFGGTGFGDISSVPGCSLKFPRGIRDVAEWYMTVASRRDYVYRVFERQFEIALANLEKVHQAIGDRVDVVRITGTDFGGQTGLLFSPNTYRDLFKPFHKAINGWVHAHTPWKTFIHSCGSVSALIPDFIEAGFDILNPVQCSATGMDPAMLKKRFGGQLVLWGGGVDTQQTLPFGTPEEIRGQVKERIRILALGGGFVFAAVHNIQAGIPTDNLLALVEAVHEFREY